MARIGWVDDMLQRWALAVTVGDGSGYPVKSVLHPSWSPPTPGLTPTLKSVPGNKQTRVVHQALVELGRERPKLLATVTAVYVLKRQAAEAAALVDGCQPDTIGKRVQEAHRWLAARLASDNTVTQANCNIRQPG
jgi:hypothetical protein